MKVQVFLLNVSLVVVFASCASKASEPELFLYHNMMAKNLPDSSRFVLRRDEVGLFAIKHNYDLSYQNADLSLQFLAWGSNLRAWLPEITIDAGQNEQLRLGSDKLEHRNASLSIKQTVWDGGRLWYTHNIQRSELIMKYFELDSSAARIYDEALGLFDTINAAESKLTIRKESLKLAHAEHQVLVSEHKLGLCTYELVLDTALQIQELELSLENERISLDLARNDLSLLIGISPLPILFSDISSFVIPAKINRTKIKELIGRNSYEIKKAEYLVNRKKMELDISWIQYLPIVEVVGGIAFDGKNIPFDSISWHLGLNIKFDTPLLQINGQSSYSFNESGKNLIIGGQSGILPNPSRLLSPGLANIKLGYEQERVNRIKKQIPLIIDGLLEQYELLLSRWHLSKKNLNILSEKIYRLSMELDHGLIKRSELVNKSIELNSRELDVINSKLAVLTHIRKIERQLELAPGEIERVLIDEGVKYER
jgi:hypothetical protein